MYALFHKDKGYKKGHTYIWNQKVDLDTVRIPLGAWEEIWPTIATNCSKLDSALKLQLQKTLEFRSNFDQNLGPSAVTSNLIVYKKMVSAVK
jgi:hypothetical protein